MLLFVNVLTFPTQYFSQMESEIDPKNMCFPTSMINSALSVGHSFDKDELDKYDNFIHSTIVTKYVNRYAPKYIKQMINSGEYDKRELWQIEELAFNSYMNKKVCELKTNKLLELEKDHNLLREEYRDFKFEDISKLVNKINSLTTAVEEMRGESDKRTMSGIVRDPYGRI